jgi:hypothetical protein
MNDVFSITMKLDALIRSAGFIMRDDEFRLFRRYLNPMSDRYKVEAKIAKRSDGWRQYDTDQDASYFGVWVNVEMMAVLCFAEGDLDLTLDATRKDFAESLKALGEFHGEPPPAFIAISDTGEVTEYFDPRPTAYGAEQ